MKIYRYEQNPLLTPHDVMPYHEGFEVIGAFNAGITVYQEEIIMLVRIAERPLCDDPNIVKAPVYNSCTSTLEIYKLFKSDSKYDFSDPRVIRKKNQEKWSYLTSLSYLRIARSKDGRHFTIDNEPFIYPSNKLESLGIEDPRITKIEDTYYIYYSAASQVGVGEAMVSTKDFKEIQYHGMIFAPENKDVAIFPELINGKYYALHRPVPCSNASPEIWIAESENLLHWGNHQHLLGTRAGKWDACRIGGGAVPFRTNKGWLELYHGATEDHRYCMGAVLLDINDPAKVIARSEYPLVEPEADYETDGFFGGVVFSCGVLVEQDVIKMYYGAADTSMACIEMNLKEVLDSLTYY
ncbi:BtaManbiosPhlase [Niallia taxi]|uniref:BtaManbiosPhlase n=1 Tax=Niallia taxi TaxID=2499688 RepID=UPI00300A1A73